MRCYRRTGLTRYRMEFARSWLNEEWFVEGSAKEDTKERPYDRWLARLLEHILSYSSNKDKSFAQFMVDLPEIPKGEISRLGEMCKNPEQCVSPPRPSWS